MIDHKQFEGHTPGPWRESNGNARVVDSENKPIVLDLGSWMSSDEQDANAALIAATPELLAENRRLRRELAHLVRLLEPLEKSGELNVPGLATLNGARAALNEQ